MPLPGLPTDVTPPADKELWRLTKGRRTAVCWQRRHPLGLELRIEVNGDTLRTTVEQTVAQVHEQSVYMRAAMVAKGWTG